MASNEAQVIDNEDQANSTLGCDTLTDRRSSISKVVKFLGRNVESWQCCRLTGVGSAWGCWGEESKD